MADPRFDESYSTFRLDKSSKSAEQGEDSTDRKEGGGALAD
jgi:hypothetical protein